MQRWTVLAITGTADAVQIALAPLFAEGVLSPFNAVLDVVVALTLTALIGWHFAFLPGFLIEQVPFLDLAPTWTIAAMLAMRGRSAQERNSPTPNSVGS